ncbi:hypothetical protein FRC01_009839 [Tulasnella sp. 417]|nr:hypothetical protein FRC01_009839 [Tulasnella sp. 417]
MLARCIILRAFLFAVAAIASQVHEVRDVTTEFIVAVTDDGTSRLTTVTSTIKSTYVPNATEGISTGADFRSGDLTSTQLPIDTSTACYCSIPVTTGTTQIQTVTINGPTPTITTITVIPASPDMAATRTICPCEPGPTNHAAVPTTNAGVIPTTQSASAVTTQETAGTDDGLFLNASAAVAGVVSVKLFGVATCLGLVAAGTVFL